ncbi:MAG: A/G-specific adenine glycosylase [Janthinobacterium lividum]
MNLSSELQNWYLQHKRNLPWRNTTDAYTIWLSEVILQQTRVEQGLPYFYRFLEKYPDVTAFANASEDEVLKLWQGLGYYSRGRNMLFTARQILENNYGIFPTTYQELIKLKGIGEYTAAAISSFAADEAKAVVDGNVYRVLARWFGVEEPINSPAGKKIFQNLADEVLDQKNPGQHNQAMMEFGAMLCKPKNPDCNVCPVREGCSAYQTNRINLLPVKLKTVKIRERYFNYFLITNQDQILLNKRSINDIWANMYDLPLIENSTYIPVEELSALPAFKSFFGNQAIVISASPIRKHILTHQRIFAHFIHLQINTKEINMQPSWFFTSFDALEKLALPKIIYQFLHDFYHLQNVQSQLFFFK